MIYNFNLGIGWASSGVEYAQSYRAAMLRNIGADARFVFTDMIVSENIEHLTKNIGFISFLPESRNNSKVVITPKLILL